jgi:hypothetical protein
LQTTIGLDSTSAVALMRILETLARDEQKTIITSIHQPSSAVFFAFDKLMLLADGNVVYFGTPEESLEHVKSLGLECPAGYNAADHHMDLLVVDSAIDDEHDATANDPEVDQGDTHGGLRRRKKSIERQVLSGTTTKQKLIDSWDHEAVAKQIEAANEDAFAKSHGVRQLSRQQSSFMMEKSFNSTWWTQYTVLVHRSLKNSRSAIFTTLNLVKAGAIGVMCGLMWFQMPYTEATVFDRSSYYFFSMTFWVRLSIICSLMKLWSCSSYYQLVPQVFDSMFSAYMAFPLERSIIFKERSSGSYHLSAYFMAKTTSEAPARLVLPAMYMIISYWMSGVNNSFWIFIASTACSLLSVLAGESIGLFLGAAVLDVEKGMVIMTVTGLGLMAVGGFFVRTVPSWILWLGWLSPFKYSYNASVQLVFDEPVPCDGSGVLVGCEGLDTGYASESEILEFLGVQFSTGFNVAMLIVLFITVRIMAFFALKTKKADERM